MAERAGKSQKNNQIDMLHGSLWDKIVLFALPLAASTILQQLFNSADVAVVGRFDSSQAMAAVGSNGAVINVLVNLFVGVSVGANMLIANYIGQGEREKVRQAVHTSVLLALISGLFLAVAGLVLSRPVLRMLSTPPDVLELAVTYLEIYFMGMPFIMLYNFGSAVLRSKGDSRRPFWFLVVGGVVNVILNLVLVIVFHLGVTGVAIATVISNVISAWMVMSCLMREPAPFAFNWREMSLKGGHTHRILKIGVPVGLQGVVFSLSNVFIQAGINSFGANASAGSAAALNFEYFAYFIISAFAQASMTFTSQNYGAGDEERCRRIYAISMFWGIGLTALTCAAFSFWSEPLMRFYTVDAAVMTFAMARLFRSAALEFLVGFYEIPGAALRGLGYSMTPTVITLMGSCVFRIFWLLTVFQWDRSFEMLMNVYAVSWVLMSVATIVAYYRLRPRAFSRRTLGSF